MHNSNPATIYTPKHLALELGISQKHLRWLARRPWTPINTYEVNGKPFRYEVDESSLEWSGFKSAIKPLSKPTRERAGGQGGRLVKTRRLNAPEGTDGLARSSEVVTHDHEDGEHNWIHPDGECHCGFMEREA